MAPEDGGSDECAVSGDGAGVLTPPATVAQTSAASEATARVRSGPVEPHELPALTLAAFEQRILRLILPGIGALEQAAAGPDPDWRRVAAMVRHAEAFATLLIEADEGVVRGWQLAALPPRDDVESVRNATTDVLMLARALRGAAVDRDAARLQRHIATLRGVVEEAAPEAGLADLPDTDVTRAIGDNIADAVLEAMVMPIDMMTGCIHEWRRRGIAQQDVPSAIAIIASEVMELWAMTGAARPIIAASATTLRDEMLGAVRSGDRIARRALESIPDGDPARAVATPAAAAIGELERSLASFTADLTRFNAGRRRIIEVSIAASDVTHDRHVGQVPLSWEGRPKPDAPPHRPSWMGDKDQRHWPVVTATQQWHTDVAAQTMTSAAALAFQQLRDRPWPPHGSEAWRGVRQAARHASTLGEAARRGVSMSKIRFDRDYRGTSELARALTLRSHTASMVLRTAGDFGADAVLSRIADWDEFPVPSAEPVFPGGRRLRRAGNHFVGRTAALLDDLVTNDRQLTQRSVSSYPSALPELAPGPGLCSTADDDLARVPWDDMADRLTMACDVLHALSSISHRLTKHEAARFQELVTEFDHIRIRHLGLIPQPGDMIAVAHASRTAAETSRAACLRVLAPLKEYEQFARGHAWRMPKSQRDSPPATAAVQ